MLPALQKLVSTLRDDLRDCLDGRTDEPALRAAQLDTARARVRAEYDATREAERTAQPFPAWRDDYLTQVAVAWVLACVFVRYLEDNSFVADCWLGGPDDLRRDEAKARHAGFFRENRTATDRDYLLAVFARAADIPAAADLFAEGKTPLWVVGPSADAATRLVNFWHARDADGDIPTFAAADGDTRFLGDLYQDLSEDVRKKYALLQTPEFVEEFILDRTLDPACAEFGFQHVRLIDPTCGSGHFLLGAFDRLMRLWQRHYHELTGREWNAQDAAGRVLGVKDGYPGQLFGIDINPYAVAIARFRLMIAACQWCGIVRLKDALPWRPRVYAGDSLYYGKRWLVCTNRESGKATRPLDDEWDDPYHLEHVREVCDLLGQKYHAVVGNPPYITVKDPEQSKRYRERYGTCHQKYSLGVPFTERFWDLCAATDDAGPAGFVGLITANSFMKREFGKKLIENFFPAVDLTHVLDTSGAYLPGHGTPTVILFGRNQPPQADAVRAVLGIKGEPSTPDDPATGRVWSSIVGSVNTLGAQTEFVSVTDVPRATFAKHPWSIGGGGAAELKEQLEECERRLKGELSEPIGFASFTGQDDAFVMDEHALRRLGVCADVIRTFVTGEHVRDWVIHEEQAALVPYDDNLNLIPLNAAKPWARHLWRYKRLLQVADSFGDKEAAGDVAHWWSWYRWIPRKYHGSGDLAFACVGTHNQFIPKRDGYVFNRHSPVINLGDTDPNNAPGLLGLLNCSVGCFWMKQTLHDKGGGGIGGGLATEYWEHFFEFAGTGLQAFPLPARRPLALPKQLDALAQQYATHLPAAICRQGVPTRAGLDAARQTAEAIRRRMIFLQDELDWECYHLYGLTAEPRTRPGDPLELRLGERAFEVVLARSGEKTAWFDRHRSTPITELPADWPADYRAVVERRLAEIEANPNVRLIERPEYKRRWAQDTWEDMERHALRAWLLDRLETERYWPRGEPALRSCDQLANAAATDPEFLQVAAVYHGGPPDPTALVAALVTAEAVPYLPVLRYKDSGLRKRAQWEETWAEQRAEDEGRRPKDAPPIPVPPKYVSADFLKSDYWRLRGKLDVPKERWVVYPGAERDGDPTPVVTWAGYDHLGQARALAAYYHEAKDQRGWPTERLTPLLGGVLELVPWLLQWHNEYQPEYDEKPGEGMATFVKRAAADLGVSPDAIRGWKPEKESSRKAAKTPRKKKTD